MGERLCCFAPPLYRSRKWGCSRGIREDEKERRNKGAWDGGGGRVAEFVDLTWDRLFGGPLLSRRLLLCRTRGSILTVIDALPSRLVPSSFLYILSRQIRTSILLGQIAALVELRSFCMFAFRFEVIALIPLVPVRLSFRYPYESEGAEYERKNSKRPETGKRSTKTEIVQNSLPRLIFHKYA